MQLPEPFPYNEAQHLFKEPDVLSGENVPTFKWTLPDAGEFPRALCRTGVQARRLDAPSGTAQTEELPSVRIADGLVEFLVKEKNFNEDRVKSATQRIIAAKGKSTQGRLDSFFGPSTVAPAKRRAAPAPPLKTAPKKGKLGGFGKRK